MRSLVRAFSTWKLMEPELRSATQSKPTLSAKCFKDIIKDGNSELDPQRATSVTPNVPLVNMGKLNLPDFFWRLVFSAWFYCGRSCTHSVTWRFGVLCLSTVIQDHVTSGRWYWAFSHPLRSFVRSRVRSRARETVEYLCPIFNVF